MRTHPDGTDAWAFVGMSRRVRVGTHPRFAQRCEYPGFCRFCAARAACACRCVPVRAGPCCRVLLA
eukprot:4821915-Prymnesium_polylepis.1